MLTRCNSERAQRHKPLLRFLAIQLVAAFVFSSPAISQTLGYSVEDDILIEIELETGGLRSIGPVAASSFSGLTMAPDGSLLGVSSATDDLWQIAPTDASSTRIAPVDTSVVIPAGLTFDACGTLWLVSGTELYELDPATGATTWRASFGEEVAGLTARGSQLFGLTDPADRLARIDPVTGTLDTFGEEIPYRTVVKGLDFDASGRLWAIFLNDSPFIPRWGSRLLRLDPDTGEILSSLEEIGDSTISFHGNLAVAPPIGFCRIPEDIPSNDALALVSLALILAAAAAGLLRRA